ncbi:hypothetical protein QOT17_015051 [Balamuthia mandrillaris]
MEERTLTHFVKRLEDGKENEAFFIWDSASARSEGWSASLACNNEACEVFVQVLRPCHRYSFELQVLRAGGEDWRSSSNQIYDGNVYGSYKQLLRKSKKTWNQVGDVAGIVLEGGAAKLICKGEHVASIDLGHNDVLLVVRVHPGGWLQLVHNQKHK